MPKLVDIIAYRFGKGANDFSTANAPVAAQRMLSTALKQLGITTSWQDVVPRQHRINNKNDQHGDMPATIKNKQAVLESVTKLAETVASTSLSGQRLPFIFGGDHTQALGTFKGIALAEVTKAILNGDLVLKLRKPSDNPTNLFSPLVDAIATNDMKKLAKEIELLMIHHYLDKIEVNKLLQKFYVIWFDAHGDFNTDKTTPSGNAHGMPAALIAGIGNSELQGILGSWLKIPPTNIHHVTSRDLEKEELRLMRHAGTHIHNMREIEKQGLPYVVKNILQKIDSKQGKIHLSFDVDGIDAKYVPATSTPVGTGSSRNANTGPSLQETLSAFTAIAERVIAIDLTEANFRVDKDPQGITFETVRLLVQAFFGHTVPEINYHDVNERLAAELQAKNTENSQAFYVPYRP